MHITLIRVRALTVYYNSLLCPEWRSGWGRRRQRDFQIFPESQLFYGNVVAIVGLLCDSVNHWARAAAAELQWYGDPAVKFNWNRRSEEAIRIQSQSMDGGASSSVWVVVGNYIVWWLDIIMIIQNVHFIPPSPLHTPPLQLSLAAHFWSFVWLKRRHETVLFSIAVRRGRPREKQIGNFSDCGLSATWTVPVPFYAQIDRWGQRPANDEIANINTI